MGLSIKYQLLAIGLLACSIAHTQTWVLEKELTLKDSSYHWTSDEWGQLYQWKENTIWLQQNQNNLPFQETYKDFGEITAVQPINGLRSVIYSENQQLFGIIDNTLQLKEGNVAFYELNFSNITKIATCARPDFIWLFDQYRERLILLNTRTLQTQQIVDNCFGGIKDAQITHFFENAERLICLLNDGRYFEFDRNLTLINQMVLTPNLNIFGFRNALWLQEQEQIKQFGPSSPSKPIELPVFSYKQLQVLQDRFYFQQGQKIKVFHLIF